MDPENTRKETIIRVADWLRGIWEMRRQTGPVQQWIDSIPSPLKSSFAIRNDHQGDTAEKSSVSLVPTEPKDIPFSMGTKQPTMTVSAPINVPNASTINTTGLPSSLPHKLVRDPSLQSDSSHCSSVESLLELRKADPEAILLGLGFGGCSSSPQENGSFNRIPKRFLQPSKLKGIAINDFMKQQQETSESFDSVSLGYRGLTGSPYVAPSEIVQKIMQRLREHESHEHDPYAMYNSYEQYSPLQCSGTLSVLSPDSRQFLETPRSKSPDMRNKRIIIGQKSFAFGHDGDLIEIDPSDAKRPFEGSISNDYNNTVEKSQVSSNLASSKDKIFEQTPDLQIDELLPKRLSFDDSSADLNDSDSLISSPTQIFNASSQARIEGPNKNSDREEDVFPNEISENASDIRRASDGFCDTKQQISSVVQERRHSDGLVQTSEHGKESLLARRRKTLKRQTKVSDTDAINYCGLNVPASDAVQCKHSERDLNLDLRGVCKRKSSCKSSRDKKAKRKSDSEGEHALSCPQLLCEETHRCIESSRDSSSKERHERDSGSECCIGETQSMELLCADREEKTTSCCCRSGTKKYWKKMEKIIQENKNLEHMVTKSRMEMAEIREMLNSVLSVRLEPGF